jgi:hypothetical protein
LPLPVLITQTVIVAAVSGTPIAHFQHNSRARDQVLL